MSVCLCVCVCVWVCVSQVEESVDLTDIAQQAEGFSGSDLREMCRDAALLCVRDFVHTQKSDRYRDA